MAKGDSMKIHEERYRKARFLVRSFKAANLQAMCRDRNILGAGFGRRTAHGEITDDPAMVVYVLRKSPLKYLPPSRRLPRRFHLGGDCVEVDVVETGPIYPMAFTSRDRPAPAGVSISHLNVTAGTLGSVVLDNTDGATCILSNNHVIADQNAASIGDPIVQPGTFDGGSAPADTIALLKRFVTIGATGNIVDGAIAQPTSAAMVIDQVKDNLIPVANPDHPAIGLAFAGSCSRAIINPIASVLSQLNISFPAGATSSADADIGMDVEKVGRTTEYTTSTVKEIDATVTIPYDFGNAQFDNQVTTAKLVEGGDSGSVVYRGGNGGDESDCGCLGTSAAEAVLQSDLKLEASMATAVRDKYLRQTLIGRWAVDLYYLNEVRFEERFRATKIASEDRDYARKLYSRYQEQGQQAFAEAERSQETLTEQHMRDARSALSRAQEYMSKDERKAADRLFKLAEKHAVGKTPRELLAMLNDKKLFEQVQEIVSSVSSIRTSDKQCD